MSELVDELASAELVDRFLQPPLFQQLIEACSVNILDRQRPFERKTRFLGLPYHDARTQRQRLSIAFNQRGVHAVMVQFIRIQYQRYAEQRFIAELEPRTANKGVAAALNHPVPTGRQQRDIRVSAVREIGILNQQLLYFLHRESKLDSAETARDRLVLTPQRGADQQCNSQQNNPVSHTPHIGVRSCGAEHLSSARAWRYTLLVRHVGVLIMLCMLIIPPTQLCSQSSAVVSELPTTSGSELRIRTQPDQADVTINGRYVGRTPLTIVDLTPGTVRVNISRQGYYSVERWVRLRDQARIELDVVLEQKIGILSLSLEPADAEIYIDGVQKSAGVLRLPVGDYTLYVTRFGYADHRERLTIRENRTTVRHITLSPVPFELHNLDLSRSVFNPLHPGSAGSTSVRFDVTAAGSAALTVVNAEGRTVFQHQISDFTQRRQRFVWDGQDRYNNPLPSGEYTLTVEAQSADHATRMVRSLPLTLDHSLDLGFRTTRSSTSGALLAPDIIALPRGVFQVHAIASRHVANASTALDPALPVHLGLRLGLGADLELAAVGDLFISASGATTRLKAGSSLRWVYSDAAAPFVSLSDRLIAALQASLVLEAAGTSSVNPHDANASWPSLRLASPVGLRSSYFRLVVTPELVVSNSYPDDKTDYSNAGFPLFWSYTRAALFYDYRGFSAALSAAVRHEPFVQGWSPAAPLYTAVELHQSIPRTPVVLSLFSSAETARGSGPTLFLGAGMGILY